MFNWFVAGVLALVLMGTQRFMYKVAAEKGCDSAWTTCVFMGTVTVLSTVLFALSRESLQNPGFLLSVALVNSLSFAVGTISHMEALKHLPAAVTYPLIRLNAVIVILFSLLYFQDHLSAYQAAGMLTAVAVMFILARQAAREPSQARRTRGFFYISLSVLAGSVAAISSKFAALHTNKLAFMALSYLVGTLFSLLLTRKKAPAQGKNNRAEALKIGLAMGLINFAGFYCFLRALSDGPLSIVVSIVGLHFVIAIVLSALIYKEKLTPGRLAGIALTIISIILLRA